MGDPLITSDDLAVYLNDPGIDVDRASLLIDHAQAACESVLSPLPPSAAWIVTRIAGTAYTSVLSPRAAAAAAAGGQFGGASSGGVYLTRADVADLRRAAGGGGAFSIDTLPAGYAAVLPWWDTGVWYPGGDFDQIPT